MILTDNREVHFQTNMFKEFIAIDIRHINIAQYHVEITFFLPQKFQGNGSLGTSSHCNHLKEKTKEATKLKYFQQQNSYSSSSEAPACVNNIQNLCNHKQHQMKYMHSSSCIYNLKDMPKGSYNLAFVGDAQ